MDRLPTPVRWALLVGVGALLLARIAAIYTEAFNWDELSFLYRVERSLALGRLMGGGRPGLAVVPLMPLVDGCRDEVAVMHMARLGWTALTIAQVLGVFVLVRELIRRSGQPDLFHAPLMGAALTCMTPIFWRWSLQVRTDQIALAAAIWGVIALLRSDRRLPWALLCGLLTAIGFLSSQKAAYVAALGAALTAVDVLRARPVPWRRSIARAALAVGLFALLLSAFYLEPSALEEQASFRATLRRGVGSQGAYGDVFGHATYLAILARQPVHLLLVLLLGVATYRVVSKRQTAGAGALPFAWVALLLGLAIALFHRSSFAYFWMTLGTFVGVALGVGLPAILGLVADARARRMLVGGAWLCLLLFVTPAIGQTLEDTQAVQRDSYAFIQREFAASDQGMQLEGGLFCHASDDPLPVLMLVHLPLYFEGPQAPEKIAWLKQELRTRPVKYILGAHTLRLLPFPEELKRFWSERYVPYYKAVMIPGRALSGRRGTAIEFEALVAGRYRWLGAGPPAIEIDGEAVDLRGPIELDAGVHRIVLQRDTPPGALVLAVDTPPEPDPYLRFFSAWQRAEIALTGKDE